MKKATTFFTKITLGFGIVTVLSALSMAEAPLYINYQGKLTNSSGVPISEAVSVTFKLWSVPTGGSPILTESNVPITPNNGVFTYPISVPPNFFSTYSEAYLSVTLAGSELLPRQRLVSVPYALAVAQGSVGPNELAPMTLPATVVASSLAVNAVDTAQIKDGKVTKEKLDGSDYIDVYKTKGDNRLIVGGTFTSGACNGAGSTVKYYSCGGVCENNDPQSCDEGDAIKVGRLLELP